MKGIREMTKYQSPTTKKLTTLLQKMEEVQTVKKGRTNQYILKANQVDQPTLFG